MRGPSAAELLERVLYRDGLMLVIDKPAGLPVHAGPSGGPNLEQAFDALRFGLPRRPALAHRLDRDTSGCLVLGRHPKALRRLGRLFAEGRVEKVYWAIVAGAPQENEGRVELPLKKLTRKDGWRMVVDAEGQRAVTDYRVLAKDARVAWLELRPRTGRTHQIRVHCAALGCPVLGDPVYGTGDGPLQLHSRAVVLPLYPAKPPVAVEAPPPPHMAAMLKAHGWLARFVVREERPGDRAAIRAVNRAAFGGTAEADLVDALRADGDALVSLVAEDAGAVVGHVMFSPMRIEGVHAAALAPLAVAPDRQRQGIGTALVRTGLAACRSKRIEAVIVVGEPAYYRRFGFSAEAARGLTSPFPGPHFMALALVPGALDGVGGACGYARAFAPLLPPAGTC